ncbi:MAG: hypothetical protein RLY70_3238, partial [Planctomycetota bacterium]
MADRTAVASGLFEGGPQVIAAAEVPFEPHIRNDKKVAATHFLDLQFRLASPPVPPGDRHGRPTEPT